MSFAARKEIYRQIEEKLACRIITYVTGDRQNAQSQLSGDALPFFVKLLDEIGVTEHIALFLYTRGGDIMAAWSIVNLIRSFCDRFTVIVPFHCHSAGTIICLGADKIIMTKQATLGPIDPSYNSPLNPISQLIPEPYPVSVEQVNAYFQLLDSKQIVNEVHKAKLIEQLAEKIHPLVLGQVYKTNSQIKRIADRLLSLSYNDSEVRTNVINFLCSESGSHDYTINRAEARDHLKLNIEKPDPELYRMIKSVFDDFHDELNLSNPFMPLTQLLNGQQEYNYELILSILECSGDNGYCFIQKGKAFQTNNPANPYANFSTDSCWTKV